MSGRTTLVSMILVAVLWTIYASLVSLRNIRLACEGDNSNNALCGNFPMTSNITYWGIFGISILVSIIFLWSFINFAGRLRERARDSFS